MLQYAPKWFTSRQWSPQSGAPREVSIQRLGVFTTFLHMYTSEYFSMLLISIMGAFSQRLALERSPVRDSVALQCFNTCTIRFKMLHTLRISIMGASSQKLALERSPVRDLVALQCFNTYNSHREKKKFIYIINIHYLLEKSTLVHIIILNWP